MFDSLVREAQSKVDDALTGAMKRVAVGLLLAVAAGFATAALAVWINRQLGPELGNLIVALVFLVAGLIAYMALIKPVPAQSEPREEEIAESIVEPATASRRLSDADRELLLSAVTTGGPILLPRLIRLVLRNLPLIAALAAAIFVMSRPVDTGETSAPPAPAE
jgi:L-lactate permease